MPNEIKWNDRFCIGVDTIDRAHQRLFAIFSKLLDLKEDTAKQQHACREGIKYFKSYALKHFAEEEAYMQSIQYPGYAMHKSLHDNLKNETLPALEAELEAQNYSLESVHHFIGICVGWLDGHIMREDYAITGKSASKWVHQTPEDETDSLSKTIIRTLEAMCQAKSQIISQHYGGEDFSSGRALCYRLTYLSAHSQRDTEPEFSPDRPDLRFGHEDPVGAVRGSAETASDGREQISSRKKRPDVVRPVCPDF